MDINYELYKVFYYVAVSLSFSEASKKLYISQSAVSQSIKTLEKKLGQPLFVRSTKKVTLTPAGEILLKHVEPAMNMIARGESQLLDSGTDNYVRLHIAASDTICKYILIPYLKMFHETHPTVPIKVTNATSIQCARLLDQQKVDLIFTNTPNAQLNSSYIVKTIRVFQDIFIANPQNFDYRDRILSFQDLSDLPLMILEKNCTTSEFLRQLFLHHQLELLPEIELNSNDMLIDLARIGLGVAFVPDYCIRPGEKSLYRLNLREPIPQRQIVTAVNSASPLSPSAAEFLKMLPSV